jgi:hypothetical protein
MNDDTPDPERYLAKAREALAAANVMNDPNARAIMRRIAGGYLAMARLAEERETTSTARLPPQLNAG